MEENNKNESQAEISVTAEAPPEPAAFEIGDVVTLKSGGQNMTVESANAMTVAVVYFAYDSGGMFGGVRIGAASRGARYACAQEGAVTR